MFIPHYQRDFTLQNQNRKIFERKLQSCFSIFQRKNFVTWRTPVAPRTRIIQLFLFKFHLQPIQFCVDAKFWDSFQGGILQLLQGKRQKFAQQNSQKMPCVSFYLEGHLKWKAKQTPDVKLWMIVRAICIESTWLPTPQTTTPVRQVLQGAKICMNFMSPIITRRKATIMETSLWLLRTLPSFLEAVVGFYLEPSQVPGHNWQLNSPRPTKQRPAVETSKVQFQAFREG